MRSAFTRKLAGPLALLLTACGIVAAPTPSINAEELPKYTGYTLPGSLGEPVKPAEGKPVVREEKNGLGVTVLYAVFDRSEGMPNDLWKTGIKSIEDYFVPGKDNAGQLSTRKLDTNARYLYLYQVIHDSRRESVVKSATIRLLVDPQLITSWGYFLQAKGEVKPGQEAVGQGIGFGQIITDPMLNKGMPIGVPISTEHNVAKERKYTDPSPPYTAGKPYLAMRIGVGNKAKPIADDPTYELENPGRAPEEVMLLNSAVFEGPPKLRYDSLRLSGVGYGSGITSTVYPGGYGMSGGVLGGMHSPYYTPYAPLSMPYLAAPVAYPPPFMGPAFGGFGGYGYGGYGFYSAPVVTTVAAVTATSSAANHPHVPIRGVMTEDDRNRSPAIRAYWLDHPLKPGERSTLFGFTSDYPPTYEDVRIRGNSRLAIGAAVGGAPDVRPAALVADGTVPTPIAFDQATAAPSVGTIGFGGIGTTGGTFGGGGGGFPGAVAALPGFGGTIGGGPSGGGGGAPSGGGSGNGSPSQAQSQAQAQTPTTTTPTTPTPTVNVNAQVTASNTGGNNSNTGGNNSNTGGNNSNTGGNNSNTGGNNSNTGGNNSNTGGNNSNTGGNNSNTGGNNTQSVNVSTPVNVTNTQSQQQAQAQAQAQLQSQRQSQRQNQNNHNVPSAVVPEPASLFAALVGLPVFLLFARRKKASPETQG